MLKYQPHLDEDSQKTRIQTQQYMDERKGNFTKSLLGDKIIKSLYNQKILTSAIQGELR